MVLNCLKIFWKYLNMLDFFTFLRGDRFAKTEEKKEHCKKEN